MNSARQSILQRPVKQQAARINEENLDREHEYEQLKLQVKRDKYNNLTEYRRRVLTGSPEEKVNLQEQRRREIEAHLQVRESMKHQEAMSKMNMNGTIKQAEEIFKDVETRQHVQKKEYLRSLMEDNKKLIDYRDQLKKLDKQEQNKLDNQVEFFDRYKSYR